MSSCLFLIIFLSKLLHGTNGQIIAKNTPKQLGRLDLLECAVLQPAEYDKRAAAGLCPPQPTRIVKTFYDKVKKLYRDKSELLVKKKKDEKKDWLLNKRIILKAVFLGKQSIHELQLQNINYDFEFIEGLFLILQCPTKKQVKNVKDVPNIEWYFDGSPVVTDSSLSWRVKITPMKHLQIWPLIVKRDDGRYECFIDGKYQGSVTIHVISAREGLQRGLNNYLITMLFAIPFVMFAIFYRLSHPQREVIIMDDPVVEFYEKILDLKTNEMKENITKTIYKDKVNVKGRNLQDIRSSSDGKAKRSNRDTVMTILNVAEMNHQNMINLPLQKVKVEPSNLLKLR